MTDLTSVAAQLSGVVTPSDFVPTNLTAAPIAPMPIAFKFGQEIGYEFYELFQGYYDIDNKVWKDPEGLNLVSADIKAEVGYYQKSIDDYDEEKRLWDEYYAIQKEVQYRIKFAQAIIAIGG